MLYRLLADAVLVLHALFIAFVVLGGLLALRYPWAALLHLPAAAWGAYVELSGRVCPLTPLENRLRVAGGESGYSGGFIEHYLVPLIYPSGLTRGGQLWLAVAVVAINVGVYAWALRRRHARLRAGTRLASCNARPPPALRGEAMRVQDVMTSNPTCCSPQASLQEAARMMAESDCGEIPVLDEQRRPTGVITDRDIACRAVAEGKDPRQTTVREVMTSPVITVTPETDLEECCEQMESHQIRRIPVVDENGLCCGMVSQADIARAASPRETAEVVREISRPSRAASA